MAVTIEEAPDPSAGTGGSSILSSLSILCRLTCGQSPQSSLVVDIYTYFEKKVVQYHVINPPLMAPKSNEMIRRCSLDRKSKSRTLEPLIWPILSEKRRALLLLKEALEAENR